LTNRDIVARHGVLSPAPLFRHKSHNALTWCFAPLGELQPAYQ
jgi:hypothetical protein